MCGITGIISFNEAGQQFLSRASAAAYSLIARGPDGEGIVYFENAALGHRRLKIIDVSNKSAQPMKDKSGRYTIVFNGEIFNFRELKKELQAKGVSFKSEGDTEVLLYLYIHEGEKCIDMLDGEFAFAVHDNAENSLFIARDPYGIKPFYYYADHDKFIFASELKGIMEYGVEKKIDTDSLSTYLQLNYIPSPSTIYKNVQKLEPGRFALIKNAEWGVTSYYNPVFSKKSKPDYERSKKELREKLTTSVQNRMLSDVPLGTFLSGGIDSSIITAIAAQHTKKLSTFSIGYRDEKYFDETEYATLMAKKIGTDHSVFLLSNSDLFEELYHMLDHLDEPFADSSALAVYILSKKTKEKVKVALSGDGADELFGGYNKHAAELKARQKGIASFLAAGPGSLFELFPSSRNSKLGNKVRQLKKFREGLKMNERERYWRWAGFANEKEVSELTMQEISTGEYENRKRNFTHAIGTDLNSVLEADLKLVLENDMLVKVDRMSMANSLEVRVPFLDQQVAALARSLPSSFKIDGKRRKKILKDAFADLLPAEILSRGKKGFEVPLLNWFRNELRSAIDDLLGKKFIEAQGIFSAAETEKIKKQLFSNDPGDSVARVWGLIVFQYWWKKNIQ